MATFRSSLNLQTQTPITKEDHKKLNSVVQTLLDHSDSVEFRQPVDYKGLGLTDYPVLIKYQMDLTTAKKKLQENKYKFTEECVDDIEMVWENCKTYNAEGSWIYKLADKLEKYFKKLVKNYLPHIVMQPQSTKKTNQTVLGVADIYEEEEQQQEGLSFDEKMEFSEKMKHLTQEQLGMIVTIIQQNAPEAFKNIDKDKCQILVDTINVQTFRQIQEQLNQWTTGEMPTKKVKI
ncbi:Bromodomain [Pseudocohnilembus persalinus]|uniref:Bromodomain n=1 Tax=Pseudocohnilembus persalinus TaxID=266149 RepID=A0A0V0QQC2_PSEPJ|nr:Bromodomain [Pseudocohnilembus persalinus]|eukprot:KRX04473.1 Bromodomain [Pseudocohnilembus persalinus]